MNIIGQEIFYHINTKNAFLSSEHFNNPCRFKEEEEEKSLASSLLWLFNKKTTHLQQTYQHDSASVRRDFSDPRQLPGSIAHSQRSCRSRLHGSTAVLWLLRMLSWLCFLYPQMDQWSLARKDHGLFAKKASHIILVSTAILVLPVYLVL